MNNNNLGQVENVRLAIWFCGLGMLAIIVIVGGEAIAHDGALAVTIVDMLGKVLGGLAFVLGAIAGVAKVMETKAAVQTAAAQTAPAPTLAEVAATTPAEPVAVLTHVRYPSDGAQ